LVSLGREEGVRVLRVLAWLSKNPADTGLHLRPQMNPRRVHELMRAHFATKGIVKTEWTNLVDEHGLLMEDRAQVVLLGQFVERGVEEVLMEVHRNAGDQLPVCEVIPYLRSQVGRGNVRIANREFTVFAELVINGVARSWQAPR
jgi:hypothetical protein